jgi:L-iditol 2-dehydrogenase
MKALVLTSADHLEYLDVPEPAVGPRDVLIRVRACGICGSDVHGLDGSTGRRLPPIIMGHEAAGEVAATGSEVSTWRAGDRVTFDSTIYCGACELCLAGMVNLCPNRRVVGVACREFRQDGAFAEYVAVPEHIVHALPAGVSYVAGALVEPLSVALHAISRIGPKPDDSVVVVGAGLIGLMIIQGLRARGLSRIVAVDIDEARLEIARRLGASTTILSDESDPLAQIRAATTADGADAAFEAVGISATVSLAVESVRKGGSVVLVGNISPRVELPLQTVVTRQLTLSGSVASAGEYPECLDMIARGSVDTDALVSARRPLAEGADWFRRLRRGDGSLIKVVLEP